MAHLIDTHRYRDLVFPRTVPVPIGPGELPGPVGPGYQRIIVRELRLQVKGGHAGFIRGFEISGFEIIGPLYASGKSDWRQLGVIWSMDIVRLPDHQRKLLAGMYRGHGHPADIILAFSQNGIVGWTPWYWAVSARRKERILQGEMGRNPDLYMSDYEAYPDAPAAFDALMTNVIGGWGTVQPWLRRSGAG